jgi:hypothetical protein
VCSAKVVRDLLALGAPQVNLTPILEAIQQMEETLKKPNKWVHNVVTNQMGFVRETISTTK